MVLVVMVPYVALQVFAAVWCRGWWRGLALLPLVWMVPVCVSSVAALRDGSNLWPVMLIPVGFVSVFYLGGVLVSRESLGRPPRQDPPGFDVLPPPDRRQGR